MTTTEQILSLIAEHRKVANAATKGPWFVGPDKADDCEPHANSGLALVDTGRTSDWDCARLCEWPNARFIAHSRTAMPALLDALEHIAKYHERKMCTCSSSVPITCPACRVLMDALALLKGEKQSC